MTAPFEPLGEKARWRIIYELLEPLEPNDVLTYERIGEELGLHPVDDRVKIQMATQRALQELLDEHQRTCEPVRNVGYRIVRPAEHLVLARRRNARAGRQLRRGHDVATKVNLNGLDPQVRSALETVAMAFAQQAHINRTLRTKADEAARGIELLQQRHDKVEDRLADLERKLATKEARPPAE